MKKPKIYAANNKFGEFCKEAIELIRSVADFDKNPYSRSLALSELTEFAEDADGIVMSGLKVDKEMMKAFKYLEIIAWPAAGLDNIDLKTATEMGIVVVHTPGANADSVAEFTIALMLDLAKRVCKASSLTKSGVWENPIHSDLYFRTLFGIELKEKTLGIIGLGSIGHRVAHIARSFGMQILAYDPYVLQERAVEVDAKLVPLENLLKHSDFVSIHTPLTDETRGLIGKKEIEHMRKGIYLINTSRGTIIDEEALYGALKDGKIAFAALDVLSKEPPDPDNPLLRMENVLISPHVAGYTPEALSKKDEIIAKDFVRFFKGEKPINVANREVFNRSNQQSERF